MALKIGGEVPRGLSEIRVMGIGGAGCNAVANIIAASATKSALKDVAYLVTNLDVQSLDGERFQGARILPLGKYGAGTDPELGRAAIEKHHQKIREFIGGAKLLFIAAGMGGGTGTGGAPVVARIAREMGVPTIAVVTLPFRVEGSERLKRAAEGVVALFEYAPSILIVDNQRLQEEYPSMGLSEGFRLADKVLAQAVESVVYVIRSRGQMNMDINDIGNILRRREGPIGMGQVEVDRIDNLMNVVKKALNRPFLFEKNVHTATYKMIYIAYGSPQNEPTLEIMAPLSSNEKEVVFGHVYDPSLGNKVRVTVIAAGFAYEQSIYRDANKFLQHLRKGQSEANRNFVGSINWEEYEPPAYHRRGITLPRLPEEPKEEVFVL